MRSSLIPLEFTLGFVVVLVVALQLLPLGRLIDDGDGRFNKVALQSVVLPDRVLPRLCAAQGGLASPELAVLCQGRGMGTSHISSQTPVAVEYQFDALAEAFARPIKPMVDTLRGLEQQQREGLAPEGADALNEQIVGQRLALKPYLEAYGLEGNLQHGPLALQCLRQVETALAGSVREAAARAGALVWLGAHLDGLTRPVELDDATFRALEAGWQAARGQAACRTFSDVHSVATRLGEVVSLARNEADEAHKAVAIRHLLEQAWWQWAVWALFCLLLVSVYRRGAPENRWPQTGLVLLVWALLGWLGRVWLPYLDGPNRQWLSPWLDLPIAPPPWPLLVMGGLGAWLWLLGQRLQARERMSANRRPPAARQAASSRLAFPFVLLLIGVGWLVILDLSATGPIRNRYLGLYHQGTVWLSLGLIVMATLWRQRLGFLALRYYGLVARVAGRVSAQRHGAWAGPIVVVVVFALLFFLLKGNRQITSELGRLWLIAGMAWFFYFSGDLTLQMAAKHSPLNFLRFLRPLVMVLLALVAAMVMTDDMGPLLITAYSGGLFLAAAVSYVLQQRGRPPLLAHAGGLLALLGWVLLLTEGVFALGHIHETTASRLESLFIPLAAGNDQIGLIAWFRAAVPMLGFGVGQVPWCGYAAGDHCMGVPLQIHSDYTLTALWGLFGPLGAIAFVLLSVLLIYRVIIRHSRVSTGAPTLVPGGTGAWLEAQPLLSWICVIWLILLACQLAVTVAGNLRVLPLTGVTYPFVSLGNTSMFVNAFLMGLAMTVDVRPSAPAREVGHD